MSPWTPEKRAILRQALRKAQAAQQQRELAHMNGEEGLAIYEAASAFQRMLDEDAI